MFTFTIEYDDAAAKDLIGEALKAKHKGATIDDNIKIIVAAALQYKAIEDAKAAVATAVIDAKKADYSTAVADLTVVEKIKGA